MSLTALVWLSTVAGLSVLAFRRPVYGFSLYLFTFYLSPQLWWWGRDVPDLRWNLLAGTVFLAAVVWDRLQRPSATTFAFGPLEGLVLAIFFNATFVHVLLAPSAEVSAPAYLLLVKFTYLFFALKLSVRNDRDFRLALWSIVLGAAYLGFEATFNDRGTFYGTRLEGIGAAGVANANQLASLLVTVLPIVGALFFTGRLWEKALAAFCGPLILNVVLLCNSRGAFLGLLAGAVAFLAVASGPVRKKALLGLLLAAIVGVRLVGDPRIVERFTTIFVSSEERDNSAAGRLVYWRAGLDMIADRPFGSGGDGFKTAFASTYLRFQGVSVGARSVHSGVINEACEWGLQGLLLKLMFLGVGMATARRTLRHRVAAGDVNGAVTGVCLIAAASGFFVTCFFGDYLDEEWGYWMVGLMALYARLYGAEAPAGIRATAPTPAARPAIEPRSVAFPPALPQRPA